MGKFSKDLIEYLEMIGSHVGMAISNSLLYEKLRDALQVVQRLAERDSLTELYNRRRFSELAERAFQEARRYHRPLSMIMLDIDHFKRVNDTYGHLIGDQVLQHVAECCSRGSRNVDVVGRYGGEEFTILLPETGAEAAMNVAQRLRAEIAESLVHTPAGAVTVTVSLGVATEEADVSTLDALLNQADHALLQAKRSGRNRVRAFTKTSNETVQRTPAADATRC